MAKLFVYGTLTPGRSPNCVADLVGQFQTVGTATVRGVLYDCGHYPGLVLGQNGEVRGMLVDAPDDPKLLARLDAYEGFVPSDPAASLFIRVPALAATADGREVDCQTYVYNKTASARPIVQSGDWWKRETQRTSGKKSASGRRPVIGITVGCRDDKPTRYEAPADYSRAIEMAGGLPLLLPFRSDLTLIPEIADLLDGVIFSGGNDLDPALYGETWHARAVPLDPDRQRFELALIAEAERRRMPVLAICLGCQLMNVHRGGSLVQYLPDESRNGSIEHRFLGDNGYRHPVSVTADTVLAETVGTEMVETNSRHKQAINRVGRGLRVTARAPDGVIEGIEDPSMPLFIGVQWHPENLATAGEAKHLALFKRLVETARSNRAEPEKV